MDPLSIQLPLFKPGEGFNPLPSGAAYVPALLHRPGELRAVALASEETWATMVPIFHLVGPAGRGNHPTGKRIASQLTGLRGAIGTRTHYLDVVRMSRGGRLEDVRQLTLRWVYEQAQREGLTFIPVHELGANEALTRIASAVAASDQRGIALRIRPMHSAPDGLAWADDLRRDLHRLEITSSHADLIVDLGFLVQPNLPTGDDIAEILTDVLEAGPWRNVILLGGSIPPSMQSVERATIGFFRRHEWDLFRSVVSRLPARLVFGDYGIQNERPPEDRRPAPALPNIRYTLGEFTFVARGETALTKMQPIEVEASYGKLCRHLVDQPRFSSSGTWGEQVIVEAAAGGTVPRSQYVWRGVGTSRHIWAVSRDVVALATAIGVPSTARAKRRHGAGKRVDQRAASPESASS